MPSKLRSSTKTYEGRPCRKCKSTLKYLSTNSCIQCRAEKNRAWAQDNPEEVRASLRRSWLRRHYGITPEEYWDMLEAQDYCCAICKTRETGAWKFFAIDHNHSTGKIRGLLCNGCNVGIARFADDPELLQRAIAYLEQHK